MKTQKNQLLLIEDVDGLGRSGDIVTAKPGFIRNYLLPRKLAVVAQKHTLRMREKLKDDREKRAVTDKKEAEALSKRINEMTIEIEEKVDPDGHMYGSVTTLDLVHLFEKEGIIVERKNFLIPLAIKELGTHEINMMLKENTPATFKLIVNSDIVIVKSAVVEIPTSEEAPSEEENSSEEKKEGK